MSFSSEHIYEDVDMVHCDTLLEQRSQSVTNWAEIQRAEYSNYNTQIVAEANADAQQNIINNNIAALQTRLVKNEKTRRELKLLLKKELRKSQEHKIIFWRKNCFSCF